MPNRPLTVCLTPGCNAFSVKYGGYCAACEAKREQRGPEALRGKKYEKTPEQQKFYSGARWTRCSRRHRQLEPLCRKCKKNGIVKAAEMVHHEPEREKLIAAGISPYDHRYLVSLCNACHLGELRKRIPAKSSSGSLAEQQVARALGLQPGTEK